MFCLYKTFFIKKKSLFVFDYTKIKEEGINTVDEFLYLHALVKSNEFIFFFEA